jgi:hypothetical protein
MGSIQAKKIFQNEHLIFNRPGTSIITNEQINNTPTVAWLVRNPYCCGGDEELQLTFEQPESDINVIKGVYIQMGADGFLIDGNIDDVASKLGGCCGQNAVVTQNYPNGLPAWQAPVAKTYTLSRTDDGTISAAAQAELDYFDGQIPGSFIISAAHNTGTGISTYQFQAYKDPKPQGTDTFVETARVFNSNTAPTLTGSNVFNLSGVVDGDNIDVKGSTTLASLVTALTADDVAGPMGTWSTASSKIVLTTTTKDVAVLVVGQEAP